MGPKKSKTRHSSGTCFGPACALPDIGSLYTARDVLAAMELEKSVHPDKTIRVCAQQVAQSVKLKWAQLNPQIVLIQDYSLVLKIQKCYEKASKINKNKVTSKFKNLFIEKLDKLFDILVCQCPIHMCSKTDCHPSHCQGGAHITCSCLRHLKIPSMELQYVRDQREKVGLRGGGMHMGGGADKVEALRQEKQMKRVQSKLVAEEKEATQAAMQEAPEISLDTELETDKDIAFDMDEDGNFEANDKTETNQNRTDMSYYIAEVCRYGVSDRAAAALYNAALKTVNVITDVENNLVVDKSKVRRAREIFSSKEKALRKERLEAGGGIQCLGSDGKRNKKTRVCEVEILNGEPKEKYSMKTREHIVYTEEPAGEYLCHSDVKHGTGRALASDFVDVLSEHGAKDSILAVVADGTNVNVGWKDGMIAHVERDIERNLLWLICQLHGNELDFRHYFEKCDGGFGTSGPESFKGPIGKACTKDLHMLPVVEFEKIETTLSDFEEKVRKDLSRDQQLLFRWTKSVEAGVVPPDLAIQVAGPINHARWLTLAVRNLELYTKTPSPSSGLRRVARYIMQVYSPTWFKIKCNSKFTAGPANVFHKMKLVRDQPMEAKETVVKVVQRNAYFADPGVMVW